MQHIPAFISILFIGITLLTVSFLYKATRSRAVMFIAIGWVVLQGIVSWLGFYTIENTTPPRLLLLVAPPLVVILLLFISRKGRTFIDTIDTEWAILLHTIRVPVEIGLFCLYLYKLVPGIMTFEGHNFDILSGLSAPLIWWAYRKNRIKGMGLIMWNLLCLGFLANVVSTAILSAPLPFQQLAFDQPNVAILHFPIIWLPCFIVPVVLFSHLVVIRKEWKALKAKQALTAM